MQTEKTATYFIIEAKDSLEISLSSNTIRVLNELMDAYITKTPLPQIRTNQLSLHNDIAPDSVITLFQRTKVFFPGLRLAFCSVFFRSPFLLHKSEKPVVKQQ